ncbi:MAG: carbamoyltransferase HypF, partial [Bacteroidales bacterium]|nr:carbamoyltransferase HypF [Bacteroidales bacterium]
MELITSNLISVPNKSARSEIYAFRLKVSGLVQGIGFRPFVYRIAKEFNLNGWVNNNNRGVEIWIEGAPDNILRFLSKLQSQHPPVAMIDNITINQADKPLLYEKFQIQRSEKDGDEVTVISPDIAVCPDCLKDMVKQSNRINYPFVNCTNCGPRFTIIRKMPYDRVQTTMHPFKMCNRCMDEFQDVTDRRFHAQPIACCECGPVYEFHTKEKSTKEFVDVLNKTIQIIDSGGVVAVKSLGGYNLVCDALNSDAVNHLRNIKQRDSKPFAVMFNNILSARKYAQVSNEEEKLLSSWQRPIVLLSQKKELSFQVTMGLRNIGAMLPYMPLHYLLFEKLKTDVLVFTSANLSDNPIIINDLQARKSFVNCTNAVLTNNRAIYNRVDDSVCQVIGGKQQVVRRSRGYAPLPIKLPFMAEGILAAGAELTNCFCIGKAEQGILSQHIGDLKNIETYNFYRETIERFKSLFSFNPKLIVHDLHPNYLSTKYAKQQGVDSIGVQHHHAH